MLKLHPRELFMREAKVDLARRVMAWHEDHKDLTDGEVLGIIGEILGAEIMQVAKYMVRSERHPDDPDKPAGLA